MSDKVWIQLRGGGGLGCECMAKTLPLIEQDMLDQGLIKNSIDVFQWAYTPGRVKASAGTHDLGGVIDVGQYSLPQRKVWAKWGVMMFPRTTAFGWLTGNHGHGVWHGCPHQVPYTDWQVRSGIAGGDGLGSSSTLMGKRWRNFEAPTRTWQQAVELYGKPKTTPAPAATAPKVVVAASRPTPTAPPAPNQKDVLDMDENTLRRIIREETAKPMAGPWTATFGKLPDGKPRLALQAITDSVTRALLPAVEAVVRKVMQEERR